MCTNYICVGVYLCVYVDQEIDYVSFASYLTGYNYCA